jgi:hypothetical protein
MADRDDHVLALDQRLDIGLELDILDRVRRGVANCVLDRDSSPRSISISFSRRAQDFEMPRDLGGQLVQLLGDLVAFEAGQALQAQIEDRARLRVGQLIGAVLVDAAPGSPTSARSGATSPAGQRRSISRRAPRRIGRGADQRDDLVDIGDRDQGRPGYARARAPCRARCVVRRVMTSSRNAIKATMMSRSVICSAGRR